MLELHKFPTTLIISSSKVEFGEDAVISHTFGEHIFEISCYQTEHSPDKGQKKIASEAEICKSPLLFITTTVKRAPIIVK